MIFDWISNFKGMPREGFLTSRTFPARIGIHSENCPTYSTQQPKSHPEAIFQDHTAASILCREPTIKYSFESWIAQLAYPRFIINSNTFGVQVFMPLLSQLPPSLFAHLVPSALTCTVPSLVEHKVSDEALANTPPSF